MPVDPRPFLQSGCWKRFGNLYNIAGNAKAAAAATPIATRRVNVEYVIYFLPGAPIMTLIYLVQDGSIRTSFFHLACPTLRQAFDGVGNAICSRRR